MNPRTAPYQIVAQEVTVSPSMDTHLTKVLALATGQATNVDKHGVVSLGGSIL